MVARVRTRIGSLARFLPADTGLWLRWYNSAGWMPTQREQAEQERQRADRLAKYLRSQGVDPDSLS